MIACLRMNTADEEFYDDESHRIYLITCLLATAAPYSNTTANSINRQIAHNIYLIEREFSSRFRIYIIVYLPLDLMTLPTSSSAKKKMYIVVISLRAPRKPKRRNAKAKENGLLVPLKNVTLSLYSPKM